MLITGSYNRHHNKNALLIDNILYVNRISQICNINKSYLMFIGLTIELSKNIKIIEVVLLDK